MSEKGDRENRSERLILVFNFQFLIIKVNLAVITGADGGMGMEITRAVATAGYQVIMHAVTPKLPNPSGNC